VSSDGERLKRRATHLDELAEAFNLAARVSHAALNLLHPFLDSLDRISTLPPREHQRHPGLETRQTHLSQSLQSLPD
jgi:hypothetical protein